MNRQARPAVWQMVREAVEALGGKTTNVAIRDWILDHYPGTNRSTIQCQIIVCTVNHDSRIHYPENSKPRVADTQYDFLFRPERGKVELYDQARHGVWKIVEQDDGRLAVCRADQEETPDEVTEPAEPSSGHAFAAETHLRDYLAQHLDLIEDGLQLFADEDGTNGVEYSTDMGRIDILAVDANEGLVVIELKVGRGPDAVCGQLLRYRNWVKRHIANGKRVRGIIIAQHISDRIRYSLIDAEDVYLKEYEINLALRDVPRISG
jgi:RecB family endonuclease NucS